MTCDQIFLFFQTQNKLEINATFQNRYTYCYRIMPNGCKKEKKGNWFGDIADFFVSVFWSLSSLLFSIILLRGQKELATPLLLYLIVFRCSKSPAYSQCLKITKKVSFFFATLQKLKRSAFSSKCYLNFRDKKNIKNQRYNYAQKNFWHENSNEPFLVISNTVRPSESLCN